MLQALMAKGYTSAQRLLAMNMDVNSLRTNATLRKREWEVLDEAIVDEAQVRLVAFGDVLGRGLTYNITNGLGKTILESENVSDMNDAEITMDGVTSVKNDAVNYEVVGLPLPIFAKGYQISIRKLNASRERGEDLDTTQARLSTRKVAELQENTLLNGASSFAFGGYTLYGYTDFPNRNTVTLTKNWDDSTKTGANILADVLNMKQGSIDARHYGPWEMYNPTAYETKLDDDYSTAKGTNTIRERILAVQGVNGIKTADKLTANNVLMVQMTMDNVRIVVGLDLTNVEWETQGGMITHMKVMTITVPQLRADQQGRSGIVHLA
jgi:uncharacterized linocin/CFP29 family protein